MNCRMKGATWVIFGLIHSSCPPPQRNPWNVLSVESDKGVFCYANEVMFGKHPRVGAGCQGNHPCGWRVGSLVLLSPQLQRGERGWRRSSGANGQRLGPDRPPCQPRRAAPWSLEPDRFRVPVPPCGSPSSWRTEAPLLDTCPVYLSIWLLICIL